jgi:tetratricopeptide (TPR) repeat protein
MASMVHVAGLPNEHATDLLDSLIEDIPAIRVDLKADIIQRSDGVPFFLVSYAEGLRSGAHTGREPNRLPWSLSQSIRQRVSSLPAGARGLLPAVALIGRGTSVSVLAEVLEQSEDDVLVALSPACRAGILEEGPGRMFHFSHDVIRDVAEADLEPPARILLHRRVAEALERLPERRPERRPGALADHFMNGDLVERALPYALRAGDEAERVFAHSDAEQHYRTALQLAGALGDETAEAHASARLGLVMAEAGKRTEARALLEDAAGRFRQLGDYQGESQTGAWMTGILESTDEGIERVQTLLRRIGVVGPSESHARLQEVLAYLLTLAGRNHEALAAAEQASASAREAGESRSLWRSENLRGRALIEVGSIQEGLDALERVIVEASAEGDINEVSGLESAASGYMSTGSLARARSYLKRAVQLTQKYSSPLAVAQALGEMGTFLALVCEWDEVQSCLDQLRTIVGTVDIQWERPLALGRLAEGQLCLAAGHLDQASRHIQDSMEIFHRSGERNMVGPLVHALAEVELLQGRPQFALPRLQSAVEDGAVSERWAVALLPLMSWAQLGVGDVQGAKDTAEMAVRTAKGSEALLHLADALWAKTMVTIRSGEDADVTLRETLRLSRTLGYARGEARALYAQGMAAIESHDARLAAKRLDTAGALFQRLGLVPYQSLARQFR